ncbi:MAG: indole-3-glycerol phosphate synthase TrpC [Rikenellaceae bacterium]
MEQILKQIIAHKKMQMITQYFGNIEEQARATTRPVNSMSKSIRDSYNAGSVGIIAEFKRRSPSKGWIRQGAAAEQIVEGYSRAGAAACSILTNEEFFGGRIEDLKDGRRVAPNLPILRKEFIVDEKQVYEARAIGADAILLIAACLTKEECLELTRLAKELGMEVLLEIHSEAELGHVNKYIDMLGVNNRNLNSFDTDIEHSKRLIEKMREVAGEDVVIISESGISSSETIVELRKAGFQGFLIGEAFMRQSNPGRAVSDILEEI